MAATILLLSAGASRGAEVNVVGLFPGKALVSIDGGAPRILSVGQTTRDGVKLLSTAHGTATFDIGGREATIALGAHHASAAPAGKQSISLTADPRGHFVVDGQVNGGALRFLVDTGATLVALSAADARRLAIDYHKGRPSLMNTANGVARAYKVVLDRVRIGDIAVNQVDAVVMEGDALPVALLGMSFLNRMEMKRDGQTMVLIRRF